MSVLLKCVNTAKMIEPFCGSIQGKLKLNKCSVFYYLALRMMRKRPFFMTGFPKGKRNKIEAKLRREMDLGSGGE